MALTAVTAGGTLAAPVARATAAGVSPQGVSAAAPLTSRVFVSGTKLAHRTPKGREDLTHPDDITSLNGDIFVAFQNGVGPQGGASPTGNRDSTVVGFNPAGHEIGQWDLVGKCDGLTAYPSAGTLIATVNEDAHSSVYVIDPVAASRPVHYHFSPSLPSRGGTDAISIFHGTILISASAPGTTGAAAPRASYPAVYRTVFHPSTRVATVLPLFYDESRAAVADGASRGRTEKLALTDPDSNEVVPSFASRFAGDFMLTSQGDEEQIFVSGAGTARQKLSVLKLSEAVDDTVWASTRSGAIYTTNNGGDTVEKVTGPFVRGAVYVAVTPCSANGAPATCPGPGYPANYLGRLNPKTGSISPVAVNGPAVAQGMLFLP